jgi:hypothetical protein
LDARLAHCSERRLCYMGSAGGHRNGCGGGVQWDFGVGLSDGNGRNGEIRTLDPLLPKQVRYQAALHSDL